MHITKAYNKAHKKAHKRSAMPVNKSLNLNFISVRLKFLFFFVSLIELMGWNKMPQYLKSYILLPLLWWHRE